MQKSPLSTPFDRLPTQWLTPSYPRHTKRKEEKKQTTPQSAMAIQLVSDERQQQEQEYFEPFESHRQIHLEISKDLNESSCSAIRQLMERQRQINQQRPPLEKEEKQRTRSKVLPTRGGARRPPRPELKESFYTPQSSRDDQPQQQQPTGLLHRVGQAVGFTSLMQPIKIDKRTMVQNGVTIEQLLCECKVRLSDLKAAGILLSLEDLMDLRFTLTDLVRDRELFNTSTLAQVFEVNFFKLYAKRLINADELVRCNFFANELAALNFDLGRLIMDERLTKRQLAGLKFKLSDLKQLGLDTKHLAKLGITREEGMSFFGWKREEISGRYKLISFPPNVL